MGGIALLAREAGHTVSGSDAQVYPPMSTQLEAHGIALMEGYAPEHLQPAPDCVVIGNVMSRGNPAVEYVLDEGLAYTSGPRWLAEHVLAGRWVLGVAGTHGKTTTASMLAWILEEAGLDPGFLIGGVPENFGVSARVGGGQCFVVEADEYDTAFFDKRSKFIHYGARTLVLNNLEFDHADIFPDLHTIERQFHHLVRTVPGNGRIIASASDAHLDEVLAMGCWTPVERFAVGDGPDRDWRAARRTPAGDAFDIYRGGDQVGTVAWSLLGAHNMHNALGAVAAAHHAGVAADVAAQALARFKNVKRRLELRAEIDGVRVYDDFAHHPTAIRATIEALRDRVGAARIVAVLEPRSYTMRVGAHTQALPEALAGADRVVLYRAPTLDWDPMVVAQRLPGKALVWDDIDALARAVAGEAQRDDHILIMSNGSFDGLHERLIEQLRQRVGSQHPTTGTG